jgi:rhodanese-related sulfurtransferase
MLNPQGAVDLLYRTPGMVIIDTSTTYFEHRIPGAYSYCDQEGYLAQALAQLDPDALYLIYGYLGEDSRTSAQRMVEAGFKNVYALEGGFAAWLDAGLPVETSFGCDCGSIKF